MQISQEIEVRGMEKLGLLGPILDSAGQATGAVGESLGIQSLGGFVRENDFGHRRRGVFNSNHEKSRVFDFDPFCLSSDGQEIALFIPAQAAGEELSGRFMADLRIVREPNAVFG